MRSNWQSIVFNFIDSFESISLKSASLETIGQISCARIPTWVRFDGISVCSGKVSFISQSDAYTSCMPVFMPLEIFLQPVSLAAFTVPGLSNISFVFPNVSIIP